MAFRNHPRPVLEFTLCPCSCSVPAETPQQQPGTLAGEPELGLVAAGAGITCSAALASSVGEGQNVPVVTRGRHDLAVPCSLALSPLFYFAPLGFSCSIEGDLGCSSLFLSPVQRGQGAWGGEL